MREEVEQRLRLLGLAGILAPAGMIGAGLLLAWLATGSLPDLLHLPSSRAVVTGLLTAGATMGVIGLLSRVSKRLERALRESGTRAGEEALRMAGYPVLIVVVVMSGLGEEILFRGGLQPLVGLLPAAFLFGFSHGGWMRENWAYVLAAGLSGAIFGTVYVFTGDLWTPIIAHSLHNLLSTLLLGRSVQVEWRGPWPIIRLVPDEDAAVEPAQIPTKEEERMDLYPTPYPARPTARALGMASGLLPTGPQNDICDVPGVLVGHATVVSGEGPLTPGEGPVRTGVTAILPHGGNLFAEKVPAGLFVLNGFGKTTGLAQVAELGTLETPILLTNTLSAFRAADALISCMLEQNPEIGISTGTINPVVGECNDGFLNDIQGRHVTEAHVRAALEGASSGPVAQGAVGAGTGMVCFGLKGGIGSASRQVEGYTLGALVLANFGRRPDLVIHGIPVGQRLVEYPGEEGPEPENVPPGSIMIILATDAPLDARQLTRVARRGAMGLARLGASASNGSGDFVLAFSTANRQAHNAEGDTQSLVLLRDDSRAVDRLFLAAVESVEEAVLNALWAARTVEGRDGRVAHALPVRRVMEWLGHSPW